ncbi:hypothetical protein [Alcaligenes faecalis]|uniref:Uncharacterized protein n=1 Tax=Alcaligenes faecalis TaxID=511 RepID=A0A2U2BQ32_ALCFA|nr:hypothetical protein [Alcaligenes faecalis]PWE16089.1 hypothetical protein DF183_05025 [Alcaligenes faecalis]
MHLPLLAALRKFGQKKLPTSLKLFHGSRENSPSTDYVNRTLNGTRKWLSQSAEYAVSYAFTDSGDLGDRLLWVCELTQEVEALEGRQASLISVSPWGDMFPWEFPNAFGIYANAVFGTEGPKVLLDHRQDELYKEVLLTMPQAALQVIEIVKLPEDKSAAEYLARYRFGC